MIIKLLGTMICLIGVVVIYYGRDIIKKFFSLQKENLYTYIAKVIGFVVAIIGAILMIYVKG